MTFEEFYQTFDDLFDTVEDFIAVNGEPSITEVASLLCSQKNMPLAVDHPDLYDFSGWVLAAALSNSPDNCTFFAQRAYQIACPQVRHMRVAGTLAEVVNFGGE